MAGRINVERPEFNLRDKLNELSFERLPSQKMPKGTIVQVGYDQTDTSYYIDHSSMTYTDFGLSIKLTPRKYGNRFLMWGHVVGGMGDNPNGGPTFAYKLDDGYDDSYRYWQPSQSHAQSWPSDSSMHAWHYEDDKINSAFTTSSSNWQYCSVFYDAFYMTSPVAFNETIDFRMGYWGGDKFYVNRNHYYTTTSGIKYGIGWTRLLVMEVET